MAKNYNLLSFNRTWWAVSPRTTKVLISCSNEIWGVAQCNLDNNFGNDLDLPILFSFLESYAFQTLHDVIMSVKTRITNKIIRSMCLRTGIINNLKQKKWFISVCTALWHCTVVVFHNRVSSKTRIYNSFRAAVHASQYFKFCFMICILLEA